MTSTPLFTLATPPQYQCYDCTGCGQCCSGLFTVLITAEEHDRIIAQGWQDDPEMRDVPLFIPHGDRYQMGNHADGRCVFLNDNGLCRIHAKFGEPAKPMACRLYPFVPVPMGPQVRLDIRFDCPAVAGNVGRPIPQHRAAVLALLPRAVPPAAAQAPVPPLCGRVRMTWAQLCRLTESFERLLVDDRLDLTRRMVACVLLAALLRNPRIADLTGRKLSEFLETVTGKVREATAEDTLPRVAPAPLLRAYFRQLLGVYGRIDRIGEGKQAWRRLSLGLRMALGRDDVPRMHADFPPVTFAQLEEPFGIPTGTAAEAITRFYRMRLASMGFFGHNYLGSSYLDGLNDLLLTYPILCWFARAYAAGEGKDAIDLASATRAIRTVDRHHGRILYFRFAAERYRFRTLTERGTLRRLVGWYGT